MNLRYSFNNNNKLLWNKNKILKNISLIKIKTYLLKLPNLYKNK